jgi:hypothetical protein
MKAYKEVELYLHPFFTSVLDRGECSCSCPSCFAPKEQIEGWMGHIAAVKNRQCLIKMYPKCIVIGHSLISLNFSLHPIIVSLWTDT